MKLRHVGRPREKLSRGEASSPAHSVLAVAEFCHDFHTVPPLSSSSVPLNAWFSQTDGSISYGSILNVAQSLFSKLGCGKVGMDCHGK